MTKNITPTNINRWTMTKNVCQRLTITGEFDRIQNYELYLVSGGGDQTILVWDLTTFEVTRTLRGHADVING